MRNLIRKIVYATAPSFLIQRHVHRRLLRKGRELAQMDRKSKSLEDSLELVWNSHDFRPIQIRSEISRLLDLVQSRSPKTVVEIGSAGGGTAFLFSRAAAVGSTLIAIDLEFSDARMEAVEGFSLHGQRIVCLRMDSQRQESADRVHELLEGETIDFLFIDGDHSYDGVAADFRFYSPLVTRGGLIAFHDIVPDYRQRFGRETVVMTGDVPRFWAELKALYPDAVEEIVEESSQDGYGLGVLHWNGGDGSRNRESVTTDERQAFR
jgi:cephalosporin hydroxylase